MGNVMYVGDVGTVIDVDTGSNISTATDLSIRVKKPSGAERIWAATLNGTTVLRHIILTGDLDETGQYKAQARVVMPGWSGLGKTFRFKVLKRYE